jgi:hypothetical protein
MNKIQNRFFHIGFTVNWNIWLWLTQVIKSKKKTKFRGDVRDFYIAIDWPNDDRALHRNETDWKWIKFMAVIGVKWRRSRRNWNFWIFVISVVFDARKMAKPTLFTLLDLRAWWLSAIKQKINRWRIKNRWSPPKLVIHASMSDSVKWTFSMHGRWSATS